MISDATAAPNRAYAFATALFDEFSRAGVENVCICPGSRSAALAVAASRNPQLRCWSHIDERSAGFFALGLAKASRTPVALVCTSGTAAANFHPAVIEANYASAPLLILTADRPAELREWGAGQTIDQIRLYGSHVRWFAEAALPDASGPMLRYARALACRAAAEATGHEPGPVHLNLPFREPLEPVAVPRDIPSDLNADLLAARGREPAPYTQSHRGAAMPTPSGVDWLCDLARRTQRGVIVCGPQDSVASFSDGVAQLGSTLGWPIFADATSQLRCGPHTDSGPVIAHADLILGDERFASRHAPDVALCFGATPVSKTVRQWFERTRPAHVIRVDPGSNWNDPDHLASDMLRVDPSALCGALLQSLKSSTDTAASSDWLGAFLHSDRRAAAIADQIIAAEDAMLEPRAVRELADLLPPGALLYVSNSMPIRDLEMFLPMSRRPLRILCNRGANGIDGMVSSASGASAAGPDPVVLLVGDLALVHDIGGLLASRGCDLRIIIVVLNNEGGGIFSYLPIAEYGESISFEEYFRTPHGLDLGRVSEAFGASFTRIESWEHFRASFKDALASRHTSVIEVPIDRDRSVAHHRKIQAGVVSELAAHPNRSAPGITR